MSNKKYHVTLSLAEREQLKEIIRKGKQAAAKIRRAHLLGCLFFYRLPRLALSNSKYGEREVKIALSQDQC